MDQMTKRKRKKSHKKCDPKLDFCFLRCKEIIKIVVEGKRQRLGQCKSAAEPTIGAVDFVNGRLVAV